MKPLLTMAEAADYIGVSKRTMQTLTSTGEVPAARLGKKIVRYRPEDLDRWIKSRTVSKDTVRR